MKICHLSSAHTEKDIRIFYKQCISLAQSGFDVNFIVPSDSDKIVDSVRIIALDVNNSSRMKRFLFTPKLVFKKALEINADVYHFHDPELIHVGLMLKRKGKKVIYDIHEDFPKAMESKKWIPNILRKTISRLFEIYENYASKQFDYLITATPYINDRFLSINKNSININNYPLISELDFMRGREINKENQVCYVGGLSIIRGASQLIKSSENIKGKLLIAGVIASQEISNEIEDNSKVEYVGKLDRVSMNKLLMHSKAGIVTFLPEPNHINSQPNKMFEYMAAGIPIVCSNFPLWVEIAEKHNCGICVDPTNHIEITEAINFFLENPIKANEMGNNGRNAVLNTFNWDIEEEKLLNCYKDIMKTL